MRFVIQTGIGNQLIIQVAVKTASPKSEEACESTEKAKPWRYSTIYADVSLHSRFLLWSFNTAMLVNNFL